MVLPGLATAVIGLVPTLVPLAVPDPPCLADSPPKRPRAAPQAEPQR